MGAVEKEGGEADGVGEEGADEDDVGVGAQAEERRGVGVPVGVEMDGAEGGPGEVAVAGVPLDVFLDEVDVMAAVMEGLAEGTKGGGVAVAPGGGDGQAIDGDLHRARLAGWLRSERQERKAAWAFRARCW